MGLTITPPTVTENQIILSDVTTDDVSTSKHGFAPKGDGSTTTFLNGNGAYSTPAGGSGITIGLSLMLIRTNYQI